MEHADHTIVQDPEALRNAQQLSLEEPTPGAEGAPELPGYVLRRRLGRGSFGEVWEATQSGSGQAVAVKVFNQPRGLDFRYLQHEIKRLRQVAEHPHVVTLLDADFHHDPPFYSMGLYQQSLAVWRQERKEIELEQVVRWFHQIAQALKFTHDKGLLHCDLKPANVLLDAEQRVKVADFGQAVEKGLPGSAVGSLGYMAPEQASLEDSSPDVRWDIYGLGATIYFLLSGRPPRLSEQSRETMGSITDPTERLHRYRQVIAASPLVPLKELYPAIDADLDLLINSCLELEPARRPQSVAEVIEDLERRRDKRPLLCARPWSALYRARRYARRNALSLGLAAVMLASAGAAANEYYQRAEEQRHSMALQQFDMGWQIARAGRTGEAALWWRKALDTDSDILPARAALDSVSLKLVGELVHGSEAVTTVGVSPDGQWLASADAGGRLKLWKAGKVVAEISGLKPSPSDAYTLAPEQFAFTPDGGHLLTTSGLYALGQETPLVRFEGEVAIDPAGKGALCSSKTEANYFDTASRKMVPLAQAPRPAMSVAFGTDPGSLTVLGTDGKVDLYCRGRRVGEGLHDKVGALAFSPDGDLLVTCSDDRTAKLFSAHTGQEQKTLDHGWRVTSARFTPDGERLITTCYNGDIRLWDVASGLALMHGPMRHSWFAYGTVGHSNGDLFASYGVDGQARVWRRDGSPFSPWFQHGSPVRDVAFDEVEGRLVTAGQDGRLRLWELGEERKSLGTFELGTDHELSTISLDPRGELLAVGWLTFPDGGGALLIRPGDQHRWPLGPSAVQASEVLFSPDGERIAVAFADGKARLFNRQGNSLSEVDHGSPVLNLAFSPDGKTLMSASADGTVKLSGGSEKTFRLGDKLMDAKLSFDGAKLGAVSSGGRAVIWDVATGRETYSTTHPVALRRLIFDRQGRLALLCGQDGVARLVDLSSQREILLKHDLMVTNGSFDSRSQRVATTSLDGAVKVWDTRNGGQLPSPAGHQGPVLMAEFSPDDSLILSVSKDGLAQLWESTTGLPFGLPVRHQRIAYDGAFSKDGRMIATCGHDGAVRLTSVPLQAGAVILSTSELETSLGSRLSDQHGKTVCESVSPKSSK